VKCPRRRSGKERRSEGRMSSEAIEVWRKWIVLFAVVRKGEGTCFWTMDC
jgi:hypothetical protein